MNKRYKILLSVIPVIFFLAFAAPLNPPAGGWTQQFMPNIGSRQIRDIFFLDSLNGWAVTPYVTQNDTAYVLKTTNSGDNWFFANIRIGQFVGHNKIKFLNSLTGFVCGNFLTSGYQGINKSTDGGTTWTSLNNPPTTAEFNDMVILNENTIWLVASSSIGGGVFFTSNGGVNWTHQFSGGNQNPNKIYMYNERIGFMSNNSALPNIYKTTNGGGNWSVNVSGEYFTDMYFADSLTGWKCMPRGMYDIDSSVRKTTNGGINWFKQILPYGGIINSPQISKFSGLNKDTIWGCGGSVYYPSGGYRGILFRTTNGGINWLFQVPDTSIHIVIYGKIQFINRRIGWAYESLNGIHTTTGGNDTFYTGLQLISNRVPKHFKLYQNYPNPFNPRTTISYELQVTSYVVLSVYDITGKKIIDLVNQKQSAGTYQVDFSGNGLSSGVYFYKITVNSGKGVFTDTKKMILVK